MSWEPTIFEITRDGYVLSTDPARVNFDLVHGFLARDSYWAQGMTADRLKRALSHSLPVGVYAPDGSMAAFARLVTDYAVFGYLRDSRPFHRRHGRRGSRASSLIPLRAPDACVSRWRSRKQGRDRGDPPP